MKVWIVEELDYDSSWIVAVYASEELADEHANLIGGNVSGTHEVLNVLSSSASDPAQQQKYTAECEKYKQSQIDRQELELKRAISNANVRPHNDIGQLCDCNPKATYTFYNAHGYCTYCGGWRPDVFRQWRGEDALRAEIDKLDIYDRTRMRHDLGIDTPTV